MVHQLLGDAAGQPKVVDYIQGTDFSVCSHQTSDLTLLYRNGEEVYGTKKFRWSRVSALRLRLQFRARRNNGR